MKFPHLQATYSAPNSRWFVFFGSTRTDIQGEYSWETLDDLLWDLKRANLTLITPSFKIQGV